MSSADSATVVAIVVLLVLLGFFALAETSLTRMSRVRAMALVEEGKRSAGALLKLVEAPERFLNGILLLVNVLQTVLAVLVGFLADRLFGTVGVLVGVVVNVVLVFVLTEAAPKTWAVQHPDAAALRSAPLTAVLTSFPPLRLLARGLIGLSNVILPGRGLKRGPFVSEEELLAMADVAVEEEVLESEERALIHSIIEFGDTVVREVMVPRPDMVTVDSTFRVVDAIEVSLLNGYSRIPVTGGGIDDIVGVVYAKDLMRAEREGRGEDGIAASMRQPRFVPETKRVAELMREMQAQKFHMAIVVDEYGGTSGLVTLEDLIEELVGEIVDEYDVEDPLVEPLPGGDVRVNARMAIDELNELLHTTLPEGDWDTVGGLMFNLLGHVPHEGEAVEFDGHRLRADKIQGRRISRVLISRVAGPPDPS
jgi:CBS domain containing-hemolysin-like protein